jgi:hypothetical protein
LKIPDDLIENRNRDLTACNIVPQPTALPRASQLQEGFEHFKGGNGFKYETAEQDEEMTKQD